MKLSTEEALSRANDSLAYDPDSGFITRKSAGKGQQRFVGKRAGYLSQSGYRNVNIGGTQLKEHRVIWFMAYGTAPYMIDHINGDKSDNRLCNLREATREQNCMNRVQPSTNSTGLKGISKHSKMNKWQASIQSNGSRKYLGYFDTPEQAHEAYKAAASVLHGSFANFGNSAITHAKELLK